MKDKCNWTSFYFFLSQYLQLHGSKYLPMDTYKHSLNTCWFIFKKLYSFTATFAIKVTTFLWPTCFHKESSFNTRSLSHSSILLQTLHLTWCTFPSTPTTYSTQGNFATHVSWKWVMIHFILFFAFFLILKIRFYLGWIKNNIIYNKFDYKFKTHNLQISGTFTSSKLLQV
jgi:hypothetical protein